MTNETPMIGVLISGRGSNLQALIDATRTGALRASIGVVISNRSGVEGLAKARAAGIETLVLPHGAFDTRADYDDALVGALKTRGVRLACFAGFMRLLGAGFCEAFPNAVLNIHPSLLPAFPGVNAQEQAITHGARVSGATVHFVTPELDAGPIVAQAAVPVDDGDTAATLSARILAVEHAIYPAAVDAILNARWRIVGRRVIFD